MKAVRGVIVAAGLALFLLICLVLPLDAASSPSGGSEMAGGRRWKEAMPYGIAAVADISETLDPPLSNELTSTSEVATPDLVVSTTQPITTPTSTPTLSPALPITTPTSTPTPSPTLSPTLVPTTPPDTPTPTVAPPPTAVPSPVPSPTPTPTSTPPPWFGPEVIGVWAAVVLPVGLGFLFIVLLVLLLVLFLRRRKRKEPRKPTAPLPLPVTGPYLESVGISGGSRRFALKPEGVVIGRAPENDLVITQDFPGWETVSRRHARVYRQAERWVVEDLNSMNGVYVNDQRTGRNLLRDGWQLGIGGVKFVFRTGGEGEAGQ